MTLETDYMKLPIGTQIIPSEEFIAYCEAEFKRRMNSGEDFDEPGYRGAMELVKQKLMLMEAEGRA